MTRWVVKLEPMPDGAAFLPIPDAVMTLAGWKLGDEVEISVTPSGSIVLVRHKLETPETGR